MNDSTPHQLRFPSSAGFTVRADFEGGAVSSDFGALLLQGVERQTGLIARLASAIEDKRHPSYIDHSLTDLLRQRIFQTACGYADGYPRHCSTGTPVLVNGVRTRLVGRVSMDMLVVDLTPIPDAGFGTEVTLWGRAANGAVLPIDDVAQAAVTVGYELMCAVAPRVPVTTD